MDVFQYKEMFINEAQEYLQEMNRALLKLEDNPQDGELLNQIFRGSHTLKGMAATMGYDNITRLSHQMEDILDKLRKGETKQSPEVINILFECFDFLQLLVDEIVTGKTKELDLSPISTKLEAILKSEMIISDTVEKEKKNTEESISKPGAVEKKTESIRVHIKQLDILMNLVGELVINKAQLTQIGNRYKIKELNETLSQIDRVANDLQTEMLKTRMVPVSLIFDRFPRVVRDISKARGKEVNLEILGREIELDRIILEELGDPLIHLIRNAVDHGIETPEERLKNNKPRIGNIILSAARGKGLATIEVIDDGGGIDLVRIRETAVVKEIVTSEEAAQLSSKELLMLICDPRFTTAKEVSDISGRGVGMDVVKTKIESFNGFLEIYSEKGKGTKFILKLPLSLAIIKALLVKVGGEIYAIPLSNISEIATVKSKEIKTVEKEEVILLRDKVVALRRLNEIFKTPGERQTAEYMYIISVEAAGREVGLVIDSFIGQQEIVIKTLGGLLKRAKGFSGSTILGDGRVALIVDVNSLV